MNLLEKPTTNGTIVVAKIGGSVLQREELLDNFISDVQSLVKTGVSIVIIHGGGPSIDLKLAAANKVPTKIQGLRVTDTETLAIVVQELSIINELIVQKLSVAGLQAIGSTPNANSLLCAEKLALTGADGKSLDLGFVAEVAEVNLAKLLDYFQHGAVPVLAPIGSDKDGIVYNINADSVALAVASALKGSKLINITDVPGLLADASNAGSIIKHLTLAEAEKMLNGTAVSGGMLPKLTSCIKSLRSGVKSVQIIDGQAQHGFIQAVNDPSTIGSLITDE